MYFMRKQIQEKSRQYNPGRREKIQEMR
jgi:hypothetical protein